MNNNRNEDIWSDKTYNDILFEIKEYLQLYLFKDARIDSQLTIGQLFSLDEDNFLILKKLHFLISDEVTQFVKALPYLMRNLSHSTNKEEIETHGKIIGQINWNHTLKQRMDTGLKDKSLFVCNTNKKLYDLPENRLLKYILNKIINFIKDISITHPQEYMEEITNYHDYLNNIYLISNKTVKDIHLKNVELPRYITTKTVTKTIKSHNNLYEYLVKSYQLYEKLFINYDNTILLELLDKHVLIPTNKDVLYEVYILFKIMDCINHDSLDVGLLKSGNDYIIRAEFNDKLVNIYYQHLPEYFKENNLKKLKTYYDLELYNKRPDIIIEYVKNNKKTYKIIEIKRTQDPDYIRDSIYKVFGYLKDYEEIPLVKPNILVVWNGIKLLKEDELDKQDILILNHEEFLTKINDYVLYEKERIYTNDYWQQLKVYHEKTYSYIGDMYNDNWYAIDLDNIPYKIANIQLKLNTDNIEIQLYHIFFKDVYDYLYEHKDQIEDEIGEKLKWNRVNSIKYSSQITLKKQIDYNKKENWITCIKWHSEMINKFKNIFTKYLKQYDLERWRKDVTIKADSSHRKYWNIINNSMKNDNLHIYEVSNGGRQRVDADIPNSWYVLRTDYGKKTISVELFIFNDNKLYEYLENYRESIEQEIGEKVIWNNDNKYSSRILISTDKYNPKHEELWKYCIKWQLDMIDKFYYSLNHRIKEYEAKNSNKQGRLSL